MYYLARGVFLGRGAVAEKGTKLSSTLSC